MKPADRTDSASAAAPAGPGEPDPQKRGGPVVLGFDGALVCGAGDPMEAVHEAYRWVREGNDLLIVVSAPEGEGAALFALAEQAGHGGRSDDLPRLLRISELHSAALLALALERAGLKTVVLDPHEMDLRAEGDPHESDLVSCGEAALRAALARTHVAVVPGHVALNAAGDLTLLGAGGADQAAAFLGARLGAARVRLVRAAGNEAEATPKARRIAEAAGLTLETAAPGRIAGGVKARRLKVALLGCGTVGGGVLAFLKRHADLFEPTGILVRSPDSDRYAGAPAELLTDDPAHPGITGADVVVESIGGLSPAAELVEAALRRGQDVVTANKEIYARRFAELDAAARESGAELRASACVGGGVPVMEAAARARAEGRKIISIEGVANGTTNFVLDEMEAGRSLEEAVRLAQEAGYAEADPSADIDGWDAAAKMAILSRIGLGAELSPDAAERDSLRPVTLADIQAAAARGERLRHVGHVSHNGFSVRLVSLKQDDFLAGARGPENRFRIVFADGQEQTISGLGAGRWPTAEAMFADLLDLHRLRAQSGAA